MIATSLLKRRQQETKSFINDFLYNLWIKANDLNDLNDYISIDIQPQTPTPDWVGVRILFMFRS